MANVHDEQRGREKSGKITGWGGVKRKFGRGGNVPVRTVTFPEPLNRGRGKRKVIGRYFV